MIAYGGSGSPAVPEFAVTGIQVEMGLTLYAAQKLVADVLSLKYRLPQIFAVLHAGDVDAWRCRMVAAATRDLTIGQAGAVDERLTQGRAGGQPLIVRLTRKRLQHLLDQILMVEDPDRAEATIADMLAARDVSIRPGGPGVADISGSLSAADGARLQQRLAQLVGWMVELGDTRTKAVLRSVALGMLAEPGLGERLHARICAHRRVDSDTDTDGPEDARRPTAPLPATVLYAHFDRGTGTWSLDGDGPLTRAEAEDLIGHSQVTIKPVIDLAANLSYTGYVAPPKLKEQLRLMNAGFCTFPYCDRPAWHGDYDHATNYPRGPTSSRNGHLPCRPHHRSKTFDDWTVYQPAPGIWLWTDPRGNHYLVTAGTTTRLRLR